MSAARRVPQFALFGEAAAEVDERFVHVELLERRSRPQNWTIRPHAHRDLHQLIVIVQGDGTMRAGNNRQTFAAPALLVVPAGEVHGFDFAASSDGYVVTFIDRLLREMGAREPSIITLFKAPLACALLPEIAAELARLPSLIERELAAQSAAAVEGLLAYLLVLARRATGLLADTPASEPGPRAALVARYRMLIERELRSGWAVDDYARALGVSKGQLRQACTVVAGRSSIALLHDRLITEAKRNLIYTDMRVAEVAYDLGFDDPAYFSRFFTRRVGCPPARFRHRMA